MIIFQIQVLTSRIQARLTQSCTQRPSPSSLFTHNPDMVNNLAVKVREGRSRQAERLQIWHLAETLPCLPINSATHSSFRQRHLHPGLMLPQKSQVGKAVESNREEACMHGARMQDHSRLFKSVCCSHSVSSLYLLLHNALRQSRHNNCFRGSCAKAFLTSFFEDGHAKTHAWDATKPLTDIDSKSLYVKAEKLTLTESDCNRQTFPEKHWRLVGSLL